MGAAAVADAAVKAGARGAAVARISEARRLRAAGFSAPILLLGGLDAEDDAEVLEKCLTPTLADWPTAQRLARAARSTGRVLAAQGKVDTAITRYRPPQAQALGVVRRL